MKKLIKSAICVFCSIFVCISATACSDILMDVGTGRESSGITVPTVSGDGMNFEIKVTNSLDIVSDGVAVLDVIRPSVVEIYTVLQNGTSSGSGVVLSTSDTDENGKDDKALIVTCHHVIDNATGIVVKAIDGSEYDASLVGSDPDSDICVLMVSIDGDKNFDNISSATWYDRTADLKVGTEVYAIGNPLGTLGGTVTSGIVSAINRDVTVEDHKMTLIQTDAAINGGNSGGGLFDKNTGALIGIVNAGYASSTAQGLSFAIPGSQAIDIIEQIIANGYIEGRYDFGVEFGLYKVSTTYWSSDYYVGITALEEFGMFIKNGFAVKDIITSIKIGEREEFVVPEITNYNVNTIVDDLTAYLNDENCKIGDTVTVKYRRYTNGINYTEGTKTFEVSQYVYGN